MLRLDPGEGRIRTARHFTAWEGGGEYNDTEIGRAVVYMANKGGGKLAEPAAPAPAASAPN